MDGLNEDPQSPINSDGRLTAEQFDALAADPVSYPPKTGSCGSCQSAVKSLAELTLDQLFEKARSTKSDINEYCDKLRELAAQAESVVEFGMRNGVSTVAPLAGQPRRWVLTTCFRISWQNCCLSTRGMRCCRFQGQENLLF